MEDGGMRISWQTRISLMKVCETQRLNGRRGSKKVFTFEVGYVENSVYSLWDTVWMPQMCLFIRSRVSVLM